MTWIIAAIWLIVCLLAVLAGWKWHEGRVVSAKKLPHFRQTTLTFGAD